MKMSWVQPEWLLCGALMFTSPAWGSMGQPEEPEAPNSEQRVDVDADLELKPSLAFLDYLGTLVKDGEAWVGPDDMPMPVDEAPSRTGDAP
jgi:hypothetical protein